jgi:hypothetical protein
MNDAHKAHWIVHDEQWSVDAHYKYGRISLYTPNYSTTFITHQNEKAIEFNIKEAKRAMINKLLEDLLGTEDWFEEN